MKRTTRVILTLSLTAILLGGTASTAGATRTLSPTSVEYGNTQIGTSSLAQAFTLKVRCTLVIFPTTRCLEDTFSPSISTSAQFAQTNNCPATLTGLATKPGVDPELGAQTCTINVTFTPTSTGPIAGTLSTGAGGPTAALHGTGVTFPTPPTPPMPGPAPPTLLLDLDAKKQELRKTLTFFATTNVDSRLQAGGSVKKTTRELAAGKKTKVNAKLKNSTREKLEDKLAASGKAKTKIEALATDQFGNADIEEITVKLKD